MAETRVLVIQLRQLGDILLTTPCLRAIKEAEPKWKIAVLSHAMGRLILDDNPYMDEHFFYEDDWPLTRQLRLLKSLRDRQFDVVFDFMGNPRSALITAVTGAHQRFGFKSSRRLAYSDVVPRPTDFQYIVEDKFKLLRSAGLLFSGDRSLTLPFIEVQTRPVLQLLDHLNVRPGQLVIALSPTHRRVDRQWPLQDYAAIADRLVQEWGAAVVWLWGPGEEAVIDEAMSHTKQETYKAPPTSFRELAALLANMDMFIGNSNGPSHVAVACQTPSLQLHGPTLANSWCPQTRRHRAVQSELRTERPAQAMASITRDQVWQTLSEMHADVTQWSRQRPRPILRWTQVGSIALQN